MASTHEDLVQKAIGFVKHELAGNDASHDWFHIERVWKLAKRIAAEEGVADVEVVELAALLHDVKDWKYSGSENAGVEAAEQFLVSQSYDAAKIATIKRIIEGVSFKNELGGKELVVFPELACVQDADRLDAIGAIGIGRTFAYAGAKGRPMHDPEHPYRPNVTKEQYMQQDAKNNTTINHFYEKLLLLKDMMKTQTGKRLAQKRHEYMEGFLQEFMLEWDGNA
eukprot:TRINITY_DN27628_c0_g1_i1.p2 TRINITY_DN27628_c0_g1~~TRINITY_DN27628_c0_g1_i1.p2  ORF type:complete len:224 (-),score=91.72 TRINITY_DN27628_c0_g1_i1:265-936(-)